MATSSEDIELRFIAKTEDLLKKLEDFGPAGKKAGVQLVRGMNTELKAARKEMRRVAKQAQDTAGRTRSGFLAMERAAQAAGGRVGEMSGRVRALAESAAGATTALGPVGLAAVGVATGLAAVAVGSVAAAAGVIKLVAAGKRWATELDGLSRVSGSGVVSPEDVEAIDQFNDTIAAGTLVAKMAGVTLSGDFATGLEAGARGAAKVALAVEGLTDTMSENGRVVGVAAKVLFPRLVGVLDGTATAFRLLDWATGSYDKTLDDLLVDVKKLRNEEEEAAASNERSAMKARELGEARVEYKRREIEMARAAAVAKREEEQLVQRVQRQVTAQAAAASELGKITAAANDSALTGEQRLTLALEGRMARVIDLSIAAKDAHLGQVARIQLEAQYQRDLADLEAQRASQAEIDAQAEAQRQTELGQRGQAALEEFARQAGEKRQLVADIATGWVGLGATIAASNQQEREANAASLKGQISRLRGVEDLTEAQKTRLSGLREELREEKRTARAAFRGRKQLERASAIAAAGAATMRMTAALAPLLGPGAVGAAAASVGPALIAQLASINKLSPPSFALGGSVGDRAAGQGDHVPISASRSEGIVNADAMSRLGREGLDALNSGAPMSATTNVYLDGQLIATRSIDALRGPQGQAVLDVHSGIPSGQAYIYGSG